MKIWRLVLVILSSVAGPPAALVTAFAAWITYTGCFITCDGGDPLFGSLLWLLAVALLVTGPVLAWGLLRQWAAVGWSAACGVVTVGTAVLLLGGS